MLHGNICFISLACNLSSQRCRELEKVLKFLIAALDFVELTSNNNYCTSKLELSVGKRF